YLLGCYLVLALKQKKVLPDVIELGVISFEPNLDRKRYLLLLTILLVISASVLIFEFIRLGAIPFFSNPNVTRWDVAYNSYVHRIALTLIQVAALGGVFLAVFRRDSRTKDWFIALSISLISLILVFLLSSRLFLMMA